MKQTLATLDGLEAKQELRLRRIGQITKHLRASDATKYGQLCELTDRANRGHRPSIARQLTLQRAKVKDEQQIHHLARKAVHQVRRIKHCLSKANRCIDEANSARAERWLNVALKRQEELSNLLLKLARWEHRLTGVARKRAAGARE